MPIFSIAKIFCIFCVFAFWWGNAFLSMLSELNFKLYSAFKRAYGESCLLAPEGFLKAFSLFFTKNRWARSSRFFEGDVDVYF